MKTLFSLPCLLIGFGALTASSASAIDQGAADQTPWVVRLDVQSSTGLHGTCTASQTSADTVITARHCLVQPGSTVAVAGHAIKSGSIHDLGGDIATAKLTTPNPLSGYATVSTTKALPKSQAIIYGYGHLGSALKRASVIIGAPAPDVDDTPGFTLIPSTGNATPGDSGGPVIVSGSIVGVVSGADGQGVVVAASI